MTLTAWEDLRPAICVVLAVPHAQYREGGWSMLQSLLAPGKSVVADVKGVLSRNPKPRDVTLWRL